MKCLPVTVLVTIIAFNTYVDGLPQYINIRPNKYANHKPYTSARIGQNQVDVALPVVKQAPATANTVSIDVEMGIKQKTKKGFLRPQFGVITVPQVCPPNLMLDHNGKCRAKS
jgi:hypothetical protein